ncbi:MAG: hypothetical protein BWY61_00670 [Firmicutes bacterium ADurb.Bin354]|nr:MAG: hypothetical protein BWY61_00670 [Firmicutes bacterium ADurb.Bin354]
MNIIYPRSDLCFKITFLQCIKNKKIRSGCLKSDHIRIHVIDSRNDIRELAVAHMSMDLSFSFHATVNETECRYGEIKILTVPVRSSERKLLSESSLIDLNDLNSVSFKIQHFISYRKRDLSHRLLCADILSGEGPVQDSYRSG